MTAKPCLHTVGMESESFNPKKIVSLKTVDDNKQYPRRNRIKLLPTDRKGVPLKDGETEVKIVTDRKEPQEVGVVRLIVKRSELRNIKTVELLAQRLDERKPTLVDEFDTEDLKDVKDNLLKGRNPIKTKLVIIRITKKTGQRVNLKVNVKICAKTTTVNCMSLIHVCLL